DVIWGI
ncbi:hypothetical protein D022_0059B, partial [Vibrio parahaemolyticus 12310]